MIYNYQIQALESPELVQKIKQKDETRWDKPFPRDSILEATLTVSPNRQYLGILFPTTPATTAPKGETGKAWSVLIYTGRQAAHREDSIHTFQ